jgi:hypothetical protein
VPPFLRLLAFFGILMSSTSALFAVSVASELLNDRETLIEKVQKEAQPSPSPSPSPAPGTPTQAEVAGMIWDARGVLLPLAAIFLILSTLMCAGCLRALRGSAWGASAWKTSCAASLGVQALLALLLEIKMGEGLPGLMVGLMLGSIYPLTTLWYLRRPQIAALFR